MLNHCLFIFKFLCVKKLLTNLFPYENEIDIIKLIWKLNTIKVFFLNFRKYNKML